MSKRKLIVCTINAVLLVLYPVLDIYLFGNLPIGWGSVLLIITGLVSLFFVGPILDNKNTINWILSLMGVSLLTLAVQMQELWFSPELWWHNTVVIAYILFIIYSSGSRININVFFKFGLAFAVVASVVCIYQRLMLIFTGSFDFLYLQGLRMIKDVDRVSLFRPSAFFTEPAHLCIFIVPMMYYAMLNKRLVSAIIIAIGTLASGSTTGFLLLVVLLTVFLFTNTKGKIKFVYVLAFLVAAFLVVKYFPTLFDENIDKINETNMDSNIRLLGGTLAWRFFELKDYIVGIGLNQLESFAATHGYFTKNYSAAIIFVVTSYGLVGLAATVYYIVSLFRKKQTDYGSILIFLGIMFSDQILFNRHLVYLLVFAECMRLYKIQHQQELLFDKQIQKQ